MANAIKILQNVLQNAWSSTLVVFFMSIGLTISFWQLLALAGIQTKAVTDYLNFYEPVARNILAGNGYIIAINTPATRYPPGYPLLLAGIFGLADWLNLSEALVISAFILFNVGMGAVFLFFLARSVWGPLLALVPTLVWMTYPFAFWITTQPYSELPFIVMLFGCFLLFWHTLHRQCQAWLTYFLLGLCVGGAMLIRPVAIGVGLVMGLTLFWLNGKMSVRLRLLLATIILAGNFVAVFTWETWVYTRQKQIILLSTGGVTSIIDGLTFDINLKGYRQGNKTPSDIQTLMRTIANYGEIDSLHDVRLVLSEEWEKNPLVVTKLFLIKAARSWYATDSGTRETVNSLIQMVYIGLILWGSWNAWKQKGAPRQLMISVWFMTLYFWAMTILVLSIARYMVPVIGLLFVLIPGITLPVANRINFNPRQSNT